MCCGEYSAAGGVKLRLRRRKFPSFAGRLSGGCHRDGFRVQSRRILDSRGWVESSVAIRSVRRFDPQNRAAVAPFGGHIQKAVGSLGNITNADVLVCEQ